MEKFSVKRPFTVLVAVIMVIMLGFVSVTGMQTNLLPNVNTPYLMVVTVYPGASPERVESEVSDVMENGLGNITGVEQVTATSSENFSLLLMRFEETTDMNSALVKVSNKIDQLASGLPESCMTPSIIEYSLNMNAFMTAAVSQEGADLYELSDYVSDTLVPTLQRADGVSSVSSTGLVDQMVQVELNQKKIDEINARVLEVVNVRLAEGKAQLDAAQAQLEAGRAEYNKQKKNFGANVSSQVMEQMSDEVGKAVETVRAQAQALLQSINQLISIVNEPEIQQALVEVSQGLQHVMDKFNETGMRDIDSLIEIVAELRSITDKLTTALQNLQTRLNAEGGGQGGQRHSPAARGAVGHGKHGHRAACGVSYRIHILLPERASLLGHSPVLRVFGVYVRIKAVHAAKLLHAPLLHVGHDIGAVLIIEHALGIV